MQNMAAGATSTHFSLEHPGSLKERQRKVSLFSSNEMVQGSKEAIPQGALFSSFLRPVLNSKGEKHVHSLHANCLLQATNYACLLTEHYLGHLIHSFRCLTALQLPSSVKTLIKTAKMAE